MREAINGIEMAIVSHWYGASHQLAYPLLVRIISFFQGLGRDIKLLFRRRRLKGLLVRHRFSTSFRFFGCFSIVLLLPRFRFGPRRLFRTFISQTDLAVFQFRRLLHLEQLKQLLFPLRHIKRHGRMVSVWTDSPKLTSALSANGYHMQPHTGGKRVLSSVRYDRQS
jgi:hypothetical protein